jgi:hypothetical protein
MPKKQKAKPKPKRKAKREDVNQAAFRVLQEATKGH